MTSLVLYRKWRPRTLGQVVGQEAVTQTLLNALAQGKVGHAYLFTGPRGTGKTSTARILAKAVDCLGTGGRGEPDNTCSVCHEIDQGSFLDLIEVDAASNRGIDEIRDLREKARFVPTRARLKVYIIDEAHMLTADASNAFLKTLEEPPAHALFILATTEPHRIPLTIASRCQRFDFRRIRPQDAVERLQQICAAEGFSVAKEALEVVARAATGSLRDAENLLEHLVLAVGPAATVEEAQALFGLRGSGRGRPIVAALLEGDVAAGLRAVNQFHQEGVDLRQVHREVVEELRALLLIKAGAAEALELTTAEVAERQVLAASASLAYLRQTLEVFAALPVPTGSPPLPLEMAMVSAVLERDRLQPVASEAPTKASPSFPPPQTPAVQGSPAVSAPRSETAPFPLPSAPTQPPASRRGLKDGRAGPAQEPPPPAPPAKREPVPAGDIAALRGRWKEVVDSLRGFGSNRNLDAILRSSSTPLEIRGDTLVIGFQYSFHKEKVEDPKYRHLVERRIAEFMGTYYKIQCELIEQPRSQGHTVRAALERGARLEADAGEGVDARE